VLVDFGLGLDESATAGLELGIIAGTPAYMSPEQFSGAAHRIDGRTDIYSLGVMLYEMLCGRLPFRASEARELLRQVRDDEPQPPRQLIRDLASRARRVCLKALAKRMQDRYSTAADFADYLRRVLQSSGDTSQLSSSGIAPAEIPAVIQPRRSRSPLDRPARRRARPSAASAMPNAGR